MNKLSSRLSKRVIGLTNAKGQMVFLLGTAHISKQSCIDVRELIETVKPSAVFLELCHQREKILDANFDPRAEKLSLRETLTRYKSGELNGFTFMYQWVMHHYNFVPGKEFLAAAEAARVLNVPIVLGDRQVAITVKRIWMGLTGWQKAKLISGFIFGSSNGEEMSTEEDDLDRLLQDRTLIAKEMNKLAELSPWLVECLVHERDKFMVLELEQSLEELREGNIVAVVGAAHLAGMERFWGERSTAVHDAKFEEESAQLHYNLQKYPGMLEESFSKSDLRKYAASVTKQAEQ